jgi:hypothetical protein
MNQEVMALYKEHKVNPMAGCLPIVLQIPIFIALFTVLRSAVELRIPHVNDRFHQHTTALHDRHNDMAAAIAAGCWRSPAAEDDDVYADNLPGDVLQHGIGPCALLDGQPAAFDRRSVMAETEHSPGYRENEIRNMA